MASRSTGDITFAIFAHRITIALDAETDAVSGRAKIENEANAAGFPVEVWRRALTMLRANPGDVEALERHTGVVLMAVRAAVYAEVVAFDAVTDESADNRRRRIFDEGYHASIVGRAVDTSGYAKPADQCVFVEGWHAFRLDLAASEAAHAVERASGALSPTGSTASLMAPECEAET